MAENLNFKTDSSWWFRALDSISHAEGGAMAVFDDSLGGGARFGRYYQWHAAMGLPDSCLSHACSSSVQGVCPSGWHVPLDAEWRAFRPDSDSAGASARDSAIAEALRAVRGWEGLLPDGWKVEANGSDAYGFRAVHAGIMHGSDVFQSLGMDGWWETGSRAPDPAVSAMYRGLDDGGLSLYEGIKRLALPGRCIEDLP